MTTPTPSRRLCLFCDREGDDREHHPTGQGWDPDIVVPLCHHHHMLVHDDWPRAGVSPKVEAPTRLHRQGIALQRWAMLVGRLASQGIFPTLLSPLAEWLARQARNVEEMIGSLDTNSGLGWRSFPLIAITGSVAETDQALGS